MRLRTVDQGFLHRKFVKMPVKFIVIGGHNSIQTNECSIFMRNLKFKI